MKKMPKFLVIEDSGLGHAFCNAKKTVSAKNALEAAKKVTQCPFKMVVEKDASQRGVWEAYDIISEVGWSGITDPEHIKVLEEAVKLGHATRHEWPKGHPRHGEAPSYQPRNQWIVTVIKR